MRRGVTLLGSGLLAACGTVGTGSPRTALDPCLVARAGPGAPGVVRVALSEAVNPGNAPLPRNDAEAFVFTQLYAGLTSLGCDERPRPLVATGWSPADDGARWTITVGAPWSALQSRTRPWPPDAVRWPATSSTVGLAGPEALALEFTEPVPGLPLLLSDPGMALVGDSMGSGGFPVATGSYRVASAIGTGLRIEAAAPGHPVLEVHPALDPGGAPLPAGHDMTITRDQQLVQAASNDRTLAVIPLAWDRAWVLGSPPDAALVGIASRQDQLLETIAGDFRPAPAGSATWLEQATCARPPDAPRRGDHLGYLEGDAVGQQLAARIVALAQQRGLLVKAVPWRPGSGPTPAAVVLPAPRAARSTCEEVHALPGGWTATPLIEGRATAIVRVGAVSLVRDGRGSVRVVAAVPDQDP